MSHKKVLLAGLFGLLQLPVYAQETPSIDYEASNQFVIDFVSCEQPAWPKGAAKRGDKGQVKLKYRVDTDGKILEATVWQSSGFAELDEAAVKALRGCQYTSPTKLGRTGPVWAWMGFNWATEVADLEQWRRNQLAAASGDPAAQYQVGVGYLYGNPAGTRIDSLGIGMLRSAAEKGHVKAQEALALQLQLGQFIIADPGEAAMWAQKAAAQKSRKPANQSE
jgi:uncharacterized protein